MSVHKHLKHRLGYYENSKSSTVSGHYHHDQIIFNAAWTEVSSPERCSIVPKASTGDGGLRQSVRLNVPVMDWEVLRVDRPLRPA